MKKDTLRGIIGLAVLLVLYILVVFLIPFVKLGTFWVSFLFTLIAFAVVAWAIYVAFLKKPDAKSRFYGFPIARIGVIYGVFQLVAGLVFMALGLWVPAWLAVVVFAVALGAAVIGLISADAVVEEIHTQDTQLKKDVILMRAIQSKAHQMAAFCADPDAAAAVEKFAEELRFSDPVSAPALAEVERDLAAAVNELQQAVADSDWGAVRQLCRKATAILAERNRLCKLNKN
ncbi:MAG: hypothetical protein IJX69_03235 [Oscillospiraceae bacterium]|nr:hypothetical protein [Oscillospiraceae bacterium]